MNQPTHEQLAILESQARVRIVRAVPGSGKTWLVAELIRRELTKWPSKTSGIAALSFTRVGGEEIRKAVGYELGHPHFVGTIDAFLFRYVIRPFLSQRLAKSNDSRLPKIKSPRLMPEESGIQYWRQYDMGKTSKTRINLCNVIWIGEDQNGKATAAYKQLSSQGLQPLNETSLKKIIEDKFEIWERYGHLTYSDAAMWTSYLLKNSKPIGKGVCAEIVRRFPLIIVDELQDTGFFLGKSIHRLLTESLARGVLVGDPDQAIYEFTGAHPRLFNSFDSLQGAEPLPLSSSRRCPAAITIVASFVKSSPGKISPNNCNGGRALLLTYNDMVADVRRVVNTIAKTQLSAITKVIARKTKTVNSLIEKSSKDVPSIGSPPITHLHQAVVMFRQSRLVSALAHARAAIELLVFKDEWVEDDKLMACKIAPDHWKRLATGCLLRANREPLSGSVYDWQTKLGKIIEEEVCKFGLEPSLQPDFRKLKPTKRGKEWNNDCVKYVPQANSSITGFADIPVTTVHGVKGETHDTTIFVCPKPSNRNRCPSVIWWSEDEEHLEERRIAYVAMTRTRGDLIVCVSEDCYERLASKRPEFTASFTCLSVDEYIAMFG